MTAARMDGLIAKLERAERGSRELDADIWHAVVPDWPMSASYRAWRIDRVNLGKIPRDFMLWRADPFTTSLDAAMRLLLPNSALALVDSPDEQKDHGGRYRATVMPALGVIEADDATVWVNSSLPLALCIAALKARASLAAESGAPKSSRPVSAEK